MYTVGLLLKAEGLTATITFFTIFDRVAAQGFSRHIPGFRSEGGGG